MECGFHRTILNVPLVYVIGGISAQFDMGVSKSRVAVTAIVATHIALFSTIWSSQIVLHTAQWAFAPLILSQGTVLSSRNTRLVPCHLLP